MESIAPAAAEADVLLADPGGLINSAGPSGARKLKITSTSHHQLNTHFDLTAGAELDVTVWLDPVVPPIELQDECAKEKSRPNALLVHGHVMDEESRLPLPNVHVRLAGASVESISDERGYFWFTTGALSSHDSEQPPETDDLLVNAEGYGGVVFRNVLIYEGVSHFIVEMRRGAAPELHDLTPRAMLPYVEREDTRLKSRETGGASFPVLNTAATTQAYTPPPSTIRVGFNCPTSLSCTSVSVYSLETYVANGLDDEWLASWTPDSLRAGAVAYRSYGAWHVFHPKTANYDICSTTACQVNDPSDSALTCQAATSATAGVMVMNAAGTEPFFAEHASEQNDGASCGDASLGLPTASWPCLSDAVCVGQPFNGHGRGMCQYGSWRWSLNQGKDWQWIINHYYNANGSPSGARNGVLQMDATVDTTAPTISAFNVSPVMAILGQPFTVNYSVTDSGGGGLNHVVLRRTAGDGSASDPGWRDIRSNPASGNGPASGSFSDAPAGVGTYWYGMAAFDNAGNSKDERQSELGPVQRTVTSGTGTVIVQATLNGSAWPSSGQGSLGANVDGPGNAGLSTAVVPYILSSQPAGSWTVSYVGGGPPGAGSPSVTPASMQTLSAGGTITFTMEFGNACSAVLLRTSGASACPVGAPTVSTSTASGVGQYSATLNGQVNPNGAATTAWFEWGLTGSWGNSTPVFGAGSGSTSQPVSAYLPSLACDTTYYFRVGANNAGGTNYGQGLTFRTSACPVGAPAVSTNAASGVSQYSATLNGQVNPNGAATTAWFEWGLSGSWGNSTPAIGAGGGSISQAVSAYLSSLACSTTYNFRIGANNAGGTNYGQGLTFATAACSVGAPAVSTNTASGVGLYSATLNGQVNPNGAATTAWFEWGLTGGWGNSTPVFGAGSGSTSQAVSAYLSSLACNTTYYFRVGANNAGGTNYGQGLSFTTSACTAPATIELSVTAMTFSAQQGGGGPLGQPLTILNIGGGTLNWLATTDASWIILTSTAGTAPSTVSVFVDVTDLAAGSYHGTVTVSAAGASPRTVAVTFLVGSDSETVSTPSVPMGTASGTPGASYTQSTGGSFSTLGHAIQYQFDWGDGNYSGWLPTGTTSAAHSWQAGGYSIKAQARCATDTGIASGWSSGFSVTIAASGGGASHPFTDVTGATAQMHDLGAGPDGSVYVLFPSSGGSALAVVKSADGGVSWGSPVSVPNSSFSNSDCRMAVDSDGTVHVVWWLSNSNGTEAYYSRSGNGGASFSTPIRVRSGNVYGGYQTDNAIEPVVAADGIGNVYVAYSAFTKDGYGNFVGYNVWVSRSTDGGNSFLPEVPINTMSSSQKRPLRIRATASNFFVLYLDETNYDLYFYRRNAGPASANTGRLNGNAGSVQYGGDFVVAPNEMTFYAAYSDTTGDGEGNITFCKSTDGGITWPACTQVNDTAYRWQYSPAVGLDSLGGLHAAWTDLRSNHRYQTYFSYSADSGATFSANVNISAPLTENNFEQPRLVVDNSNSAVFISATRDYGQVMLARRPLTQPVTVTQPTVSTNAATAVVQSGATLNGTVNPNGAFTTTGFEYGLTTSYGSAVSAQSLIGSTPQAISAPVTGLACNTPYHYRATGTNSAGTVNGLDASFTTLACPATVTTGGATGVGQAGATLNGTVNPNGTATTTSFQYGLTTAYGSTIAAQALTGSAAQAISAPVTGLACNTPYHYRATGTNSAGTVNGLDASFTTLACQQPLGPRFNTLTPCRLFDTRNASGPDAGAPALQASATRVFSPVGRCAIPSTAKALSLNVTVTDVAASGELLLYPSDVACPTASTCSFRQGRTRANNTIVKLSSDGNGTFAVRNGSPGTVDIIFDVNGYFQ